MTDMATTLDQDELPEPKSYYQAQCEELSALLKAEIANNAALGDLNGVLSIRINELKAQFDEHSTRYDAIMTQYDALSAKHNELLAKSSAPSTLEAMMETTMRAYVESRVKNVVSEAVEAHFSCCEFNAMTASYLAENINMENAVEQAVEAAVNEALGYLRISFRS